MLVFATIFVNNIFNNNILFLEYLFDKMITNLTFNDSDEFTSGIIFNSISLVYSELKKFLLGLRENLLSLASEDDSAKINSVSSLEKCFEELLDSYGTMITRICFGYSRTAEEVADLRQDSLLNIWHGLARYRGDSSMKTWVYRVTLNTCVSRLRNRQKELNGIRAEELYDLIDDSEERKEMLRELHEAIYCLNPMDKAILLLWLDEFSYGEISDMTGISKANVATRLHRAKSKLKHLMGN